MAGTRKRKRNLSDSQAANVAPPAGSQQTDIEPAPRPSRAAKTAAKLKTTTQASTRRKSTKASKLQNTSAPVSLPEENHSRKKAHIATKDSTGSSTAKAQPEAQTVSQAARKPPATASATTKSSPIVVPITRKVPKGHVTKAVSKSSSAGESSDSASEAMSEEDNANSSDAEHRNQDEVASEESDDEAPAVRSPAVKDYTVVPLRFRLRDEDSHMDDGTTAHSEARDVEMSPPPQPGPEVEVKVQHRVKASQDKHNAKYRSEVADASTTPPIKVADMKNTRNANTKAQVKKQQSLEDEASESKTWPAETEIKVKKGQRLLSKRDQELAMQRFLEDCVADIIGRHLFDNMYPDTKAQRDWLHDVVKVTSEKPQHCRLKDILRRFDKDRDYHKLLSDYLANQLAHFRGNTRAEAAKIVAAEYGLTGDTETVKSLATHYMTGARLMYPLTDPSDLESRDHSRPCGHTAFTNLLRRRFFSGKETVSDTYAGLFTSSVADKPNEKEVPLGMAGLTMAALYAALSDYTTGEYVAPGKANAFSADYARAPYQQMQRVLDKIWKQSPSKYHSLMHKLYKDAMFPPTKIKVEADAENSDDPDIDGMDD